MNSIQSDTKLETGVWLWFQYVWLHRKSINNQLDSYLVESGRKKKGLVDRLFWIIFIYRVLDTSTSCENYFLGIMNKIETVFSPQSHVDP